MGDADACSMLEAEVCNGVLLGRQQRGSKPRVVAMTVAMNGLLEELTLISNHL